MGTAHSQHSASVRVSPVCGYSKHTVNTGTKPITIHSEGPSTEGIRVTTGSEPHLASASVRSIYKQAGNNLNSRWNSRRKDFVSRSGISRLSVNGGIHDCAPSDSSAWIRSSSKEKVGPRTLKQTSHNSTNSSYIADCSPDRSAAVQSDLNVSGRNSFVVVNEPQVRLGTNRLSSTGDTFSVNGYLNTFQSHSRCDLLDYGDKGSNLSEVDSASSRLVQRRHLSELCLHLDGLNNGNNNNNHHIPTTVRSPRKSHPPLAQCLIPTYDFGTQTSDVGPFIRMATTTTSMYVPKSKAKSPSCHVTPAHSVHCTNQLVAPHPSRSPLSSEAELLSPEDDEGDDALNNCHDYANLPQSRSRSVKIHKKQQQQLPPAGIKTKAEETYVDTGRIPLPSRRLSKSRWRLMSRGKNLTKSLSCYALKFFGQQNRSYEASDQPLVGPSRCVLPMPNHRPLPPSRPPTLAMLKRGRADGLMMQRDTPDPSSDDLGQTLQRVLRLGQSEDKESAPRLSNIVSLQAKMNRSLSAFGNQESVRQRRHAVRRSTFQHSIKDGSRRDKLQILQTTSTKELLHCLSIFILQHCDNLCEPNAVDSPLYPEEIIAWIRDIDRALIQQGWTDVPFLSPANVVFLFIMIKGFVDSSITCSRELHSLVMVCLYLSYGYMGNEISYPLKPFLNAEILYSMLHENESQRFRNISTTDAMSSRNPKVVNRFRDAFWETCVRVLKCKSKEMLQLNSDAIFFTQSIAELRSYANSPEQKPTTPSA
ncbi:Cyclin-dependent kinase 5 activator 1 [Echinococcus granulosus]|uniref:Cyclin dependent kinase 5 activator 1 n=1 Tax=Echinococcus granulosus TaxID=6210 RepID=A0A068WAR4_ECHGR|nr:Cyclin-dependent kinase 5 activator 1 [Echinococcus granulosus]CDS15510.1 cyclin dependent kinase 5 activator 1 [Echinococcus granulosus]